MEAADLSARVGGEATVSREPASIRLLRSLLGVTASLGAPPRYAAFGGFHEKAGVVKSFLRRAPYIFRSESPFVKIRSNVVENSVRPASIRTRGEPWGSVHVGVHRKSGRCYLLGDLEGS